MNELLVILLDQANGEGGGQWGGMIMILAMIVIFYFFMIRPQSKKQKELRKAREAMKKGDKVVTAGGIHGRIKELKDNIVQLEIAPNVTIKIDKNSVFALPANTPGAANGSDSKGSSKKDTDKTEDAAASAAEDLDSAAGKVTNNKE